MRLFVALDLPDDVRRKLGDFMARLKPICNQARWARPEGLHVTLKFIGHLRDGADTPRLATLRSALAAVHSAAPVEMHFRGVGFFPDADQPRVFWCGVKASANLTELAACVQGALEPLGVSPDEHVFVPHLTLARFKSSRAGKVGGQRERRDELVQAASEMAPHDFGSARESKFHLFESILKPSGAEYKRIETYSFVRKAA
jgi:RNA 2',3'-cyclic 3'-phosphodiesterase